MPAQSRVEQILAMVALALLVFGCFFVLRPFLSAILWAVILCFSTWPAYTWMLRNIGSATVAAVAMHPPFGFALFYLRSVAPRERYRDKGSGRVIDGVTTGQIYWGAIPFVGIQLIMVVLAIVFPQMIMHYKGAENANPQTIEFTQPPSDQGNGDLSQPPDLGQPPDLSQPPDLGQPPQTNPQ